MSQESGSMERGGGTKKERRAAESSAVGLFSNGGERGRCPLSSPSQAPRSSKTDAPFPSSGFSAPAFTPVTSLPRPFPHLSAIGGGVGEDGGGGAAASSSRRHRRRRAARAHDGVNVFRVGVFRVGRCGPRPVALVSSAVFGEEGGGHGLPGGGGGRGGVHHALGSWAPKRSWFLFFAIASKVKSGFFLFLFQKRHGKKGSTWRY